jgi:hypothetical protein
MRRESPKLKYGVSTAKSLSGVENLLLGSLHGKTLLRQNDKYRFFSLIPQMSTVSLSYWRMYHHFDKPRFVSMTHLGLSWMTNNLLMLVKMMIIMFINDEYDKFTVLIWGWGWRTYVCRFDEVWSFSVQTAFFKVFLFIFNFILDFVTLHHEGCIRGKDVPSARVDGDRPP